MQSDGFAFHPGMSLLFQSGFLTIWCLLVVRLRPSNAQSTILSVVDDSSEYHQAVLTLRCSNDQGRTGDTTFFSRLGNVTREVRNTENEPYIRSTLVFELKPEYEGAYFCEMGGTNSSETLLTAYPIPDRNISREYTVTLGASLVVNCTIPAGNLRDRYSIVWFKGVNEISFMSDEYEHISMDDFALIFRTIKASDNSRGYYCVVNVTRNSETVTRQGSTIAVNVMAPLKMIGVLNGVSVATGNDAVFTCHATGVPVAEFRWLLNGTEYVDGVSSVSEIRGTTIYVTTTLRLSRVVEAQTGSVTCIAFHYNGREIIMVSSTTNLVVLTNSFTVQLTVRDGQIRVKGTLPVSITGFFFIRVRFHSDGLLEESLISDPSFKDTNIVDFIVANEKLPNFQDFFVTVAIESDGVAGSYTVPSNRIKVPNDVSTCDGRDNTVVVVILSVLIVFMILAIVGLMVGCAFVYFRRRMIYKASSEYSCSPKGSLHRSVSGSSYKSQSSRHSRYSSRSKSISSRGSESSDSQSVYSDSPNIKISPVAEAKAHIEEVVEVEEEEERDVRNYETIDHKVLKQMEHKKDKKIRYLDQPVNQFHLGARVSGSCDAIAPGKQQMELQPVFPHTHTPAAPNRHTVEPQPIFPNTHTGATNRLAVYNIKRDSNSSFEDLEDDCHLEFSTTVPRRY